MQLWDGKIYLGHGNSSNVGPAQNAGPIRVIAYDLHLRAKERLRDKLWYCLRLVTTPTLTELTFLPLHPRVSFLCQQFPFWSYFAYLHGTYAQAEGFSESRWPKSAENGTAEWHFDLSMLPE